MKKKSILVLLIIMCIGVFTPFLVNAKECNQESIKLKSIKLKEKSEYTEELTEATIDNNKINLDLKMYNVGDYIEYTLKVKNESDENYYFDEDSLNINSNYFDYSLSYKDNSNKIEPNKEKIIYLKVQYKKEVEKENFFSGKYKDNNIVSLLLTNNKRSVFTNPLTGSNKIIILLITMIILGIYLYYKKINNLRLNIFIILGLSLLIPISTYALCEVKLDINSNITIGKVKPNPCTYDGELVQGAEYVNGQYTYRYMQENFDYYRWVNISNDGWGVRLTDKESTDDITTKLCTSINDKPIVSMRSMFFESKSSSIDLSSFDTSNVVNMQTMFYYVVDVQELDLSSFDTINVKKMSSMFSSMTSLKKIDLHYFNTHSLENFQALLNNCTSLEYVNMDNWDLSECVSAGSGAGVGTFSNTISLKKISARNWILPEYFVSWISRSWSANSSPLEEIDVSGWDLSNTKDINGLFGNSPNLKKIVGLETWDTSNIENMSEMFMLCPKLKEIDLSKLNTKNVTNMSYMFYYDESLEELDIKSWNVSKVINMNNMFQFSTSLKELDLSGWDTSSLQKYDVMLNHCSSLKKLNMDNWNFSNVHGTSVGLFYGSSIIRLSAKNWIIPENASIMFDGLNYENTEIIDVSNWNLSDTKSIRTTFYDVSAKKIIGLETWDTSNIEEMYGIFVLLKNITELDLSSWDTQNVKNADNLFGSCINLKTIYVSDKFKMDNVLTSDDIFYNLPLLVGGNGTLFDSNHVDKEYARIDESGKPGYFTRK